MTAGHSIVKATDAIIAKGKPIAATMLEAGEADIAYKNGKFRSGRHRPPRLAVRRRRARRRIEKARRNRRGSRHQIRQRNAAHVPNGVHIAEVEIDPDTGHLTIAAYAAVDDCGRALDHDRRRPAARRHRFGARPGADGKRRLRRRQASSSPARSWITPCRAPRTCRRCAKRCITLPATTNPLGVKGVGEAGTTAAIAAVMNAVADAIPGGAGAHLEMPASAQKLWEACQRAKG
jgi:carbon-monoxide dehydrogenase large subunit